ncbi:unnamed protein product, partial [Polarella glacialis]
MSYNRLSFIHLAYMTGPMKEDKLWIDSTEPEGTLVWMQWGKKEDNRQVSWWFADPYGKQTDGVWAMRWVEDKDCQLWDRRAVERNTIYDKEAAEEALEEEEMVTASMAPVKKKVTIRRLQRRLKGIRRTLQKMKQTK